ncbi:TMC domain-containing protein [Aphelenchoides besseyi]|nr:TMC domain-containing protein [Aphelenchoides besseyi]
MSSENPAVLAPSLPTSGSRVPTTESSPFRTRRTSTVRRSRMPNVFDTDYAFHPHRLSASRITSITHLSQLPGNAASRRTSMVYAARRGRGSQLDMDRTSSKMTLDDEFFDFLYAFVDETGNDENDEDEDNDPSKPMSKQLLLSKIRQKKEVINKLRCQPWSMQRKRRTLRLAQKYLEQHESRVSRSHLYKEELRKRWHFFVRWFSNFLSNILPWESKIKRIESHFGSVVSSYFTFLRWVIFMNLAITALILAFVVIPEMIADATADGRRRERTRSRKVMPAEEKAHADEFTVVWHFGGYARYSFLFYGMASNASTSKMAGSKAEQYVFNWRVFTGWDFSIGNSETASNAIMAGVIKLRELIAETRIQKEEKFECLRFTLRVFANMVILLMLAFSIYCISFAVQSSQTIENKGNLLTKSQVPAVVSTITHVFPMIFDLIGRLEAYHPRTSHRAHLARVLVLYVLNYLTLIVSLLEKLDSIRDSHEVSEPDPLLTFIEKTKRQIPFIFDSQKTFYSRNFTSLRQMRHVLESRSSSSWPRPTSAPTLPTTSRTAAVTVDGEDVEVQSQFGPVGVNHAKALMRNATAAPNLRRYETRPIGPTVLPSYPTPLPPPISNLPTYRGQEYGPHWNLDRVIEQQRGQQSGARKPVVSIGRGSKIKNGTQSKGRNDPRIVAESLRNSDQICWETMIGQEIVRLVTVDLYITIASILIIDFLRGLWVRYCASWWCWDIESTFPEYGEFKVAENVLHIVNNQGMIWLGVFFSPLLPLINNLKLITFMYIRAWAVMTTNVPAKEIFRASRSSNFYLMILFLWLMICTLPVFYVLTVRRPSTNCGPFAGQNHFYEVITHLLEDKIDKNVLRWIKYIASPGVVIPIFLLLVLIIYFLVSLVRGLREANSDLQQQLVHERTEEKKKIFELAGGKKRTGLVGRDGKAQPKKTGQSLPEVEQKRREPWRLYHGTENALSLCPTDEPPSSMNSPASQVSPPSIRKKSAREQFDSSTSRKQTLGSLNEFERSVPREDNRRHDVPSAMTRSMPISHSGQTEKISDWNEDNLSQNSIKSAAPELTTPDELRNIMAPLMDTSLKTTESAISLAAFPKDGTPITVIFGNRGNGSRQSSNRESLISLYDNNRSQLDDPSQRSSLNKIVRSAVDSVGFPSSMPSTSIDRPSHLIDPMTVPAPEGPHPMALYAREPRRVGQNSAIMTASTSSAPPLPLHRQPPKTLTSRSASQTRNQPANAQKYEVNSVTDQFVPWPSIEEVKAQRAHLLSRPHASKAKSTVSTQDSSAIRGRSSSPLRFKEKQRDTSPEDASVATHPRRFRISISPTRQIHTDSHEESNASRPPAPNRPRYIIKQRILPGSTLSMASSKLTESSVPSKSSTPLAPRATIDEMDSPRNEHTPTPSFH